MKIINGLAQYQVYQRSANGTSDLSCYGTCSVVSGAVEALINDGREGYEGEWQLVGRAANGCWQAAVSDLHTGGPYNIDLRIVSNGNVVESVKVTDILVGDLWILAGQSNMQGCGDMVNTESSHHLVNVFSMNDQWELAKEPLHQLDKAVDAVHRDLKVESSQVTGKGAGLGLPFAVEMVRRTGVPVGLIPCAQGGTSMLQWDPVRRDEGDKSLYGAMYRRFLAVGGRVRGILWYQGCAETGDNDSLLRFTERLAGFVCAVRRDFRDDELPFFQVQIGRVKGRGWGWEPRRWNSIREQQRLAEEIIPGIYTVTAIDLELDDLIHVSTQGHKLLGKRLAYHVCQALFGQAGELGPHLERIFRDSDMRLKVTYSRVNGRLTAPGRLSGFDLLDADGSRVPIIYSQRLDPTDPYAVILYLTEPLPEGCRLIYGSGVDPYCNLYDEAGMAALAFGPLPVC